MVSDAKAAIPAASRLRAVVARVAWWEWLVVVGVFTIVGALMTTIKVVRLNESFGDDAVYLQAVESISRRGTGMTQVDSTVFDFIGRGLPTDPPAHIAADPLLPTPPGEFDIFRVHSYFILYPIGLIARFVPKEYLVEAFFVTSFLGLVVATYLAARLRALPPVAILMLSALVVWHPAWANAFEWQFYPDRLFVLLGFALMLAASNVRTSAALLVCLALLCSSINERSAAVGGIFLIVRAVLFWGSTGRRRFLDIVLGAAMVAYAFAILHWYVDKTIVVHQNYRVFLPVSLSGAIAYVSGPVAQHNIQLFLLASAALLALSLFEIRGTAIALLVMAPNVFGNIGGAEKIVWATHYHDLYLPVLAWAALLGLSSAYRRLPRRWGALTVSALPTLLFAAVFFYDPSTATFSGTAYTNSFVHRFPDQVRSYLGSYGARLRADADRVRNIVPKGVMISTVESGMPLIYDGRTVEYYPLGIDRADFALVRRGVRDGKPALTGAVSFLAPEEQQKIDALLERRMRRDGFDIDHPLAETVNGLVLLGRHEPILPATVSSPR